MAEGELGKMDKLQKTVVILSVLFTMLLFALYIINYYKLFKGAI